MSKKINFSSSVCLSFGGAKRRRIFAVTLKIPHRFGMTHYAVV